MDDRVVPALGVGDLLDELVGTLPEAGGAVVLSADGLVLDTSGAIDPLFAAHLSAVAAGLHAVATAAGRNSGAAEVRQTVVEMEYRLLVVMPVTRAVLLAVVFDAVSELASVRDRIAAFAMVMGRRLAVPTDLAELVNTP